MEPTTLQMNQHHAGSEATPVVRRRLGRGLNALLGGGSERAAAGDSASDDGPDRDQIHVELIERNPFQPRRDFAADALAELAESIKQHGVLQPLLVRPDGGRYQLIAGERRLLAARQAGLETVPCRVLELDDRRVCEAAIEENLKRKDLNVLEKAQAFQDYLDRFQTTVEELARQLSMSRSTVSNYLRLLALPDAVKESLVADRITNGHARALLSLDEAEQIRLCREIEEKSLSVRETERAVRSLLKGQTDAADPSQEEHPVDEQATIPFPANDAEAASPPQPSNHVLSLEQQLRDHFGVKVEIRLSDKEAGRIVIPFTCNDDFERIVRQLRRAA